MSFQKGISDSGGGAIFRRFVPEDGGILGSERLEQNKTVQPKIRTPMIKKKTKLRSSIAVGILEAIFLQKQLIILFFLRFVCVFWYKLRPRK